MCRLLRASACFSVAPLGWMVRSRSYWISVMVSSAASVSPSAIKSERSFNDIYISLKTALIVGSNDASPDSTASARPESVWYSAFDLVLFFRVFSLQRIIPSARQTVDVIQALCPMLPNALLEAGGMVMAEAMRMRPVSFFMLRIIQ